MDWKPDGEATYYSITDSRTDSRTDGKPDGRTDR